MHSFCKSLLAGLFLLYSSNSVSLDRETAIRGILDLRTLEFNEQTYLKLNGEWEFYWGDFVDPDEFQGPEPPKPTLYGDVPGYWTGYSQDGMDFPGTGFATYRLRILLPPGFDQHIGFDVPVFDVAVRMFLDGQHILTVGKPGTSEQSSEPEYLPATVIHKPAGDTLEVVLHVSNFQHRRGAFWKSMQIGHPDRIISVKQKYRLVGFISLGVLLAFSLFYFFFYAFYPKDKVILMFSLILAGVFIRMMNTDLYPINYMTDLQWDWIIRLEYLGTFLAFGAALWYLYRLFPAKYMLWFTRVNTGLVVVSAIIVLLFRARVFAYTMVYFQPAVILVLLYYLFACIKSIYQGNKEHIFFLAGLVLFLAALVLDIMVANSMTALSKNYTVHYALQIFIFIQAVLIIRKWIGVYKEREKLMSEIEYINKNLEKLVDERTIELNRINREVHRKNEQIEERNRKLHEALGFKNRVFSIIAHDLKSPIANLVQNSLLLDYNLSKEENRKLIHSFRELSYSALNLIENLLYWGKSQGDQMKVDPEQFKIRPMMNEVVKLFTEMARQKSIMLELIPDGNMSVYADRELLKIVCRNILSNAIKFTGKGGKVSIASDICPESGRIIISVRDNGIGIPESRLKEIFNAREMVSTTGTGREKGTGLGLRLCHELVLVNNGELLIESRQGEGTRVNIILPERPPDN